MADVPAELLRHWDIRGIALDLDNTIVPWYSDALAPGVKEWAQMVLELDIRMCLLTNNYGAHAMGVARELKVPLVRGALKPLPAAYARCLRELQTDAHQTLSVGDQLFTDVLGAKLSGMRAVYVRPIAGRVLFTTRFLRMLERPVFARLRRAGVPGA